MAAPTAPPANLDISDLTKEELAQKLLSYQQFMAKYIVDAQQQKSKAILLELGEYILESDLACRHCLTL